MKFLQNCRAEVVTGFKFQARPPTMVFIVSSCWRCSTPNVSVDIYDRVIGRWRFSRWPGVPHLSQLRVDDVKEPPLFEKSRGLSGVIFLFGEGNVVTKFW